MRSAAGVAYPWNTSVSPDIVLPYDTYASIRYPDNTVPWHERSSIYATIPGEFAPGRLTARLAPHIETANATLRAHDLPVIKQLTFDAWPLGHIASINLLNRLFSPQAVGVGLFARMGIVVLLLTLASVGFQAYRAAHTNPAQNLRLE